MRDIDNISIQEFRDAMHLDDDPGLHFRRVDRMKSGTLVFMAKADEQRIWGGCAIFFPKEGGPVHVSSFETGEDPDKLHAFVCIPMKNMLQEEGYDISPEPMIKPSWPERIGKWICSLFSNCSH
jgi:hypothetical protein